MHRLKHNYKSTYSELNFFKVKPLVLNTGICWGKFTFENMFLIIWSHSSKIYITYNLNYIHTYMGFSCDSAGKESACNAGEMGSNPGLGRSTGEGKGYPLQYSGLENSLDCLVHGVAKSRTWLSNVHIHTYMHTWFKWLSERKKIASCLEGLNY